MYHIYVVHKISTENCKSSVKCRRQYSNKKKKKLDEISNVSRSTKNEERENEELLATFITRSFIFRILLAQLPIINYFSSSIAKRRASSTTLDTEKSVLLILTRAYGAALLYPLSRWSLQFYGNACSWEMAAFRRGMRGAQLAEQPANLRSYTISEREPRGIFRRRKIASAARETKILSRLKTLELYNFHFAGC